MTNISHLAAEAIRWGRIEQVTRPAVSPCGTDASKPEATSAAARASPDEPVNAAATSSAVRPPATTIPADPLGRCARHRVRNLAAVDQDRDSGLIPAVALRCGRSGDSARPLVARTTEVRVVRLEFRLVVSAYRRPATSPCRLRHRRAENWPRSPHGLRRRDA